MTKEEAVARIAVLVVAAEKNIREAEVLADEHGLDFSFSPAYGMGGTYYGEGHKYEWVEHGWNPSSMSC
jgi:hypothetical protein